MIELAVVVLWCTFTIWVALRLLRSRHYSVRILAALAVLILNGYLFMQLISSGRVQLFGELMLPPETNHRVVALTFDDGPTRRYTGEVLDVLEQHDVRATFFLTGSEVTQNPEAARAIVAAGHEIGNHSWSHKRMVGVSRGFVKEEIERTDDAIRAAGYNGPILFRSPYGKRFLVVPWYLARTGRPNVWWDLAPDSNPALASDGAELARSVVKNTQPGSIVLLHVMYSSRDESRSALPSIIMGLRERGYRFVTVSELRTLAEQPD
ncbi:MAG TPA: polysaccharide deacetylase family protein [Thermoanaerobaculia bacterium]|nr:polysaccharide deacetylase family protein [Thermoanaerobaculia bacterium]